MSIQVKEFIHVPGENDAEYIRLLNEQIERQKKLLNKAMAKLRETELKTDSVSKDVYEQVKWERDMALKTLEEHGIGPDK